MKRIFILFALMAVALTACESGDETTDAKEYVLTLASKSVMNFTAEGGKTYTVDKTVLVHTAKDEPKALSSLWPAPAPVP